MSDLISRKTALERAEACTFTDKNEKRKFMDWLNYCLDAPIEPQWNPCSVCTNCQHKECKHHGEV